MTLSGLQIPFLRAGGNMNSLIPSNWKRLVAVTVCVAAWSPAAWTSERVDSTRAKDYGCPSAWSRPQCEESAPPAILEIDLENVVYYFADVSDWSKLATNPGLTTATNATFGQLMAIADIVAVNGKPAKGTYVAKGQTLLLTPTPIPGESIADTQRGGGSDTETFEILQTDDTPVGSIMSILSIGGAPPPGSPLALKLTSSAIAGGNGAFLGVKGQCGIEAVFVAPRRASQAEDPANRRLNGGGKMRMAVYLIPMFRPKILADWERPAVFHASNSRPVTAANPAHVGEALFMLAKGLGPVRPNLGPGQPFPSAPLAVVNSPLDIVVSGSEAEITSATGYPGFTDTYRVDFRVPAISGSEAATLQVNAAWIPSAPVSIAIQ
jgi:hypothetical protein